jgi:hypothetical protein
MIIGEIQRYKLDCLENFASSLSANFRRPNRVGHWERARRRRDWRYHPGKFFFVDRNIKPLTMASGAPGKTGKLSDPWAES